MDVKGPIILVSFKASFRGAREESHWHLSVNVVVEIQNMKNIHLSLIPDVRML